MKAKWLFGTALAVMGTGYLAMAQDPPAGNPPPPPARNDNQPPPPANDSAPPPGTEGRRTEVRTQERGVQVEGQVSSERSNRPMAFHRAKNIMGTKVSIEGGLAIGTVDDIVFADDGMIEYMVVANEGKLVSVPWAAAKFNFDQRTAIVGITHDRYKQIPTFTEDAWPRFNDPQYRTSTYSYYNVPVNGLTPRQERKVERRVEKGRRP